MAGTTQGGKAAGETNKARYDAEYLEKYGMTFYQYIGSRGGKKGHTGGFFVNRELARTAGAKGGMKSRRTSKKDPIVEI